jgi:hypothetical protein
MQVLFDHTNKRNDVGEEEETTWEINESISRELIYYQYFINNDPFSRVQPLVQNFKKLLNIQNKTARNISLVIRNQNLAPKFSRIMTSNPCLSPFQIFVPSSFPDTILFLSWS